MMFWDGVRTLRGKRPQSLVDLGIGCPTETTGQHIPWSGVGSRRSACSLWPAPKRLAISAGWKGVIDAIQHSYGARAESIQGISLSSLNGLRRKPIAPASSTWLRVPSSAKAVMKMIGMRRPSAFRRSCNSTPLKPFIWTSTISSSCRPGSTLETLPPRRKRGRHSQATLPVPLSTRERIHHHRRSRSFGLSAISRFLIWGIAPASAFSTHFFDSSIRTLPNSRPHRKYT